MKWGTHFYQKGVISNPLVRDAMDAVRREDFLPDDKKYLADEDHPIEIGHEQTNSQPYTVAFMLELLDPQPDQKILDIGSGSGWTSAILAWIVSGGTHPVPMKHQDTPLKRGFIEHSPPTEGWSKTGEGRVYAVERIPELVKFGKANTEKYNFVDSGILEFVHSDGSLGLPEQALFDRILASAAFQNFPEELLDQLSDDGVLVVPVENLESGIMKAIKHSGKVNKEFYPGFVFVPMIKDRK